MTVASAKKNLGSPSPVKRRKGYDRQGRLAFWLLLPAAIAVFGVIIYPMFRTLLVSLFQVNSALATVTPFVGLGNYADILSNSQFWASLGRTLYFTLVSTALELILGIAVAGLLNAKLKARWLFRTIVVIPWAIPTIVRNS